MPVSFLSEAEREKFNSFPADLSTLDLITFFTLSETDLLQIPKTTTSANQIGFALRIVLLRFLGFHLTDLASIPEPVAEYVGSQLGVDAEQVKFYTGRAATRTVHQRAIEKYLGFRQPTEQDFENLNQWLMERALEHDRPTLFLQILCERFLAEKLVRPAFSVVERMVGAARKAAEDELFRRVCAISLTRGFTG